jgi:hypothetical protein
MQTQTIQNHLFRSDFDIFKALIFIHMFKHKGTLRVEPGSRLLKYLFEPEKNRVFNAHLHLGGL